MEVKGGGGGAYQRAGLGGIMKNLSLVRHYQNLEHPHHPDRLHRPLEVQGDHQCGEGGVPLYPRLCWGGGRTHSPGGEGGGGSIFWKTRDMACPLTVIITLRIYEKRKRSESGRLKNMRFRIRIPNTAPITPGSVQGP